MKSPLLLMVDVLDHSPQFVEVDIVCDTKVVDRVYRAQTVMFQNMRGVSLINFS